MSGGVELDELICDLATIIGSRGQTFTKQFDRPMGSMGGLSIMAEEFRNQQAPTEKMIWYEEAHVLFISFKYYDYYRCFFIFSSIFLLIFLIFSIFLFFLIFFFDLAWKRVRRILSRTACGA